MTKVIRIPYKPYDHQKWIHEALKNKRFVVVTAARRSGKTTAAVNHLIAGALSATDGRSRFGYVAPTYRQAKRIAWDNVKQFTKNIPMMRYMENELRADFPNGSRIQLFGIDNPDSLRGLYFDGTVLDEYGMFPSDAFNKVVRPTLADRLGWCMFTGTPNGKMNDFWEKWEFAKNDPEWERIHIPWKTAGVLAEKEVEELRRVMTPEEFSQELEAEFTSTVRGAYYADQLQKAEDEGRIGKVPYDNMIPVHTFWDIGVGDATSIWFVQFVHHEIRFIEYFQDEGQGLDYYIRTLQERPYIYGEHWGPHDLKVRELSTGRSRYEIAAQMGIYFNVIPRLPIGDGINAARTIFHRCWFDKNECKSGLDALFNYRREYDDKKGEYRAKPVHDWSSHGADAFRYFALAIDQVANIGGFSTVKKLKVHRSLS